MIFNPNGSLFNDHLDHFSLDKHIVGEGGTGKSSLLRALQGQPFDEQLSTTHGIAIQPLVFPFAPKVDSETPPAQMTLNVWDFGGQQIYHTTHQFFMTRRSLYLLVWNARGDTDQARLDHWLRNIQVLAPDAPVLLVATHIDERPEDFNYNRFAGAYPQLVGHVGISNRTGAGVETLRRQIAHHAASLPLMEQMWPTSWVQVEQALKDRPERYIDLETFLAVCADAGVRRAIAEDTLSDYLHDLGKLLHYRDDDALHDFVVLKPNWLTEAISRVLDDDVVRRQEGILEHREFARIWAADGTGAPYATELHYRFRRLMERFLISYQLERDDPNRLPTRSLVPLRLSHTPPAGMPAWGEVLAGQPEIRMLFRLTNFVPPGMMSWFIVLTHLYTQNVHWREGVRLVYDGHQAQVILNPSTRELWIWVKGPAPKNFFNLLQHTVNDRIIRRYFGGLVYSREIPCNCHQQRRADEPCPYFHDYARLADRMAKGVLTAECGAFYTSVSVPELLEGIHHTANDLFAEKLDSIQNSGQRGELHLRNLIDREHRLYLMCQHPVHPHVLSGDSGYRVHQSHGWWQEVAPWLAKLSQYLHYIPALSGLAEAYDEQFFEQVRLSLAVFELAQKITPEDFTAPREKAALLAETGMLREEVDVEVNRRSGREKGAVGPALRALHAFLREQDPAEKWAGLSRVVTNDGNILWLCDEHRKQYGVM